MLLPLLSRFTSQMRVSLYHTPDLRGLLRLLVPQRFNETIGVQHIKVYLFDDSLIISGANLSESYFTNRQDRYVLLENCSEVADFFSDLVEAVGDVSLQLQPDDSVNMMDGMVHPYKVREALTRHTVQFICLSSHMKPLNTVFLLLLLFSVTCQNRQGLTGQASSLLHLCSDVPVLWALSVGRNFLWTVTSLHSTFSIKNIHFHRTNHCSKI
ncbi:hypothetical protein WMY93_032099, partial [Mugilogobius chulae]